MFDDIELPWKPFGLTFTFEEWDDLVTWYIQKNCQDLLNTEEGFVYANKLYS